MLYKMADNRLYSLYWSWLMQKGC